MKHYLRATASIVFMALILIPMLVITGTTYCLSGVFPKMFKQWSLWLETAG